MIDLAVNGYNELQKMKVNKENKENKQQFVGTETKKTKFDDDPNKPKEKEDNTFFIWGTIILIFVILLAIFWASKYVIRHIADIKQEIRRL